MVLTEVTLPDGTKRLVDVPIRPVAAGVSQELGVPEPVTKPEKPTTVEEAAEKAERKRTKSKERREKIISFLQGTQRVVGKLEKAGKKKSKLLAFKPTGQTQKLGSILGTTTPVKKKVNPLRPDVIGFIFPNPLPPIKDKGKKKVGKDSILKQESIFFK